VKAKLKELGLTPTGYGVVRLKNDEAECRKIFDFAKDMGIGIVVSEPAEDACDLIEKLVKEYDIKMAIHSHRRSRWIAAASIGTPSMCSAWLRIAIRAWELVPMSVTGCAAALSPRMPSRYLKGRIFDSHIRTLTEFGNPKAHDMIWAPASRTFRRS